MYLILSQNTFWYWGTDRMYTGSLGKNKDIKWEGLDWYPHSGKERKVQWTKGGYWENVDYQEGYKNKNKQGGNVFHKLWQL